MSAKQSPAKSAHEQPGEQSAVKVEPVAEASAHQSPEKAAAEEQQEVSEHDEDMQDAGDDQSQED